MFMLSWEKDNAQAPDSSGYFAGPKHMKPGFSNNTGLQSKCEKKC